jgi:hypothetical protein
MRPRHILITGLIILGCPWPAEGQDADSVFYFSGIIYNDRFEPLPNTHVLNAVSHAGSATDQLGIFRLPVRRTDTLLITNITYRDTLVPVQQLLGSGCLILHEQYYVLPGVRIYPWGSTYGDFKHALTGMPMQHSIGESLGLPGAEHGYVPIEMDEKRVSGAWYLLTSPVSYFYQNFNRKAMSARKVYWLEKNREKRELFETLMSRENISLLTGLKGEELSGFIIYLEDRMTCDFNCGEIEILSEVYAHFEAYRDTL